MKERFVSKKFQDKSLAIIAAANEIISEYTAQGYTLTLRQLYYQFVARDLMANHQRNYNKLGAIISDARLAGLVDWNAIEDRTRTLRARNHWDNPEEIMESVPHSFSINPWDNQPAYIEAWIEKDALIGVLERPCRDLSIPYFSCRGYTSQSAQWRAGKRFKRKADDGKEVIILHLGDHDPSGVDMTRDNQDRLDTFTWWAGVNVNRIALNMDQVEQYNPPPNPTKFTDSRAEEYINNHGYESWELDALDPSVIDNLIRDTVAQYVDQDQWDEDIERQEEIRASLQTLMADTIAKWPEWSGQV